MNNILATAPHGALPDTNSLAYSLLCILSDRQKHSRDELCDLLGGGFRAYLQQLMGGYYQNWLIHKESGEANGRKQAFYWLDERHYSGDWEADKDARAIARKQYNDRSYYGCKNAVQKLQQAEQEKAKADKEYQERIEKKKPTEA